MPIKNALHDLRYALRSLRNSPGFTAVAVLTLALGVGANTAVFSLINAVLLRPLPYPDPERLVLVWESAPFFGVRDSPVSPANYVDWKARSRSFEAMGALEDRSYRLIGDGTPEVVEGSFVTASLLRVLGTRPARGRVIGEEDDKPGAPKVALISDGLWRRRFGADPGVVGRTMILNDEQHTIIGVLSPGSEPPSEYKSELGEIWTPFGSAYKPEQWTERGRHNWMVAARLRPGVTAEQADAEMKAIGASLAREYPSTNEKVGAFVAPLRDHFAGPSRRVLLILAATTAFVLLIACSNLANLLLSRAAARSKEIAVRAALGAGNWNVIRPFLLESVVLCAAGAAAGLALATTTFGFLAHLAPGTMAGFKTVSLDFRVLGFATAAGISAVGVFSLAPYLQYRRLDLNQALKVSARALARVSSSRRVHATLICSEVALAFVLLIGAALLIQTLSKLRGVAPGFRTGNILTLRMPPSDQRLEPGRSVAFQREVLRRVTEIPGVRSAGFTNHIPLVVKGDINGVGAEGHDPETRFQCNYRLAGPGYIRTMGIPLLRGRDIEERDGEGAPYVVLINETLARTIWPRQNPIGRKLIFRFNNTATVIGVVGDIHQAGLDTPPKPEYYASALQAPLPPASLAIHTKVESASIAPAVRKAIWSIDPNQPITEMATMREILDKEVFQRRVHTTLLAGFAALALLLAAVGLYGVLAYVTRLQIPEIGLRMALGAAPADILNRTLGYGLRLTAVGLATGVLGGLALTRLMSSVLFGVEPTDPLTYTAVAALLVATAAVAGYLPARRAMRIDPMAALREE